MPADEFSLTTARMALRRFTIDDLPWLEALSADGHEENGFYTE